MSPETGAGVAPVPKGWRRAMASGIERKLTTILAADVEGYSRLMAADETAAMAALRQARTVFARLIERHRGRIANTAGDGLIADFPSVVEAVQCAVEVQTELAAHNLSRDPNSAMRFRIGLHLGDVMVEGGDLFGEGVNLAARLQGMAEPGGVLISQAVYDQIRSKVPVTIEPVGPRQPRNLPEPVAVYRLVIGVAAPPNGTPASAAPRAPRDDAGAVDVAEPRRQLAVQAQRIAIACATLAGINLATGGGVWAVWPIIGLLAFLGLRAAPVLARDPATVQLLQLGVVVVALALVNLASRTGYPWFLWPAGALLVCHLLWRAGRRQRVER